MNTSLPVEADVADRIQESPTIFTLRLRLTDPAARARYRFRPGQFNMVYLYAVGEVPISIVSDPRDETVLDLNRQAGARMRAPTRLEVVSGATHLFEEPGTLEHVAERAGAWFLQHFQEEHEPAGHGHASGERERRL